jgi:PAS domain S-box-containing protein
MPLRILTRAPGLFLFALVLVSRDAAAQPAVEAPRTIRVVMDNAYAPFAFQSDDGKLQGILVDQWQAWEKKTGIKAEIHAMDWNEALRRMAAGEFDVIDCIVETPERRDGFDFTPAYSTVEASIYFRNDISGITDLASLKGFPVGAKTGDQHIDRLRASGVTTVIAFQSNDAIVEAAKQRKINVFLADDPSALYLLHKAGIEAEFRHSAPIFRDELRRAVRKGDAAMLRTVSMGFAAIDPRKLKQIDERWFGRTIIGIGPYLTYAGYAAGAAVLLIAGLAGWNRTLRKGILQRTAELAESEQRFRQIAENIREVFWVWDVVGDRISFISPMYEEVFGRSCASLYADSRSFLDALHPDDRPRVDAAMVRMRAGAPADERYRIFRPDGSMRWIRDRAFPVRGAAGSIERVVGVAEDITELDASMSQLHTLAGRLMHAQDDERRRIAQLLHETTAQDLAALKMHLGRLNRTSDRLSDSERSALAESMSLAEQSMTEIRTLSYLLHPPFLDEMGLLLALRWFAAGFADRSGIAVDLDLPESFERLPLNTETALFRIVQESLINIHRHAGSETARIRLRCDTETLVLEIEDRGQGIPDALLKHIMSSEGSAGVGIAGMIERIEQLGGCLEIASSDQGTTVRVRLAARQPVVDSRKREHSWR